MKKILSAILLISYLLCFTGLSKAAFGAVSKEDITRLIRQTMIERAPELKDSRIELSFRGEDETMQWLNSLKETPTLKISLPSNITLAGRLTLPFQVFDNGKLLRKIFLNTEVQIFEKIVLASREIKKGSIYQAEDVKLVETEISTLPRSFFKNIKELIGQESKTTIAQDTRILDWMAGAVPLFKCGDKLTISAALKGVKVKAQGLALEDGYPGKSIKVQNLTTKKQIEGIVKNSQLVEAKIF